MREPRGRFSLAIESFDDVSFLATSVASTLMGRRVRRLCLARKTCPTPHASCAARRTCERQRPGLACSRLGLIVGDLPLLRRSLAIVRHRVVDAAGKPVHSASIRRPSPAPRDEALAELFESECHEGRLYLARLHSERTAGSTTSLPPAADGTR